VSLTIVQSGSLSHSIYRYLTAVIGLAAANSDLAMFSLGDLEVKCAYLPCDIALLGITRRGTARRTSHGVLPQLFGEK
jgi:hypothetical protein